MNTPRRLLPSISALRALEALDRLGSASAAAEELSLTQGAVSRQMQALEAQLGTGITVRDGRKMGLTPAASAYAAEIRIALDRIAQAAVKLQVTPTGGTLHLAILPAFGMRWLMPRLPDFARRHPQVTINMTTRLEPFSFATEPFDAALHFGNGDWPGTDRLRLRHEAYVPVCAPGLVPGRIETAQNLLDKQLLHIRTRPNAWRDWFVKHNVEAEGPLPGTIHDQYSTIIQAASLGLGVALVPDYLVEQELASGQLVTAFGGPVEAEGAYFLVWPKELSNDPSLQLFRNWLVEQAEPEDTLPR